MFQKTLQLIIFKKAGLKGAVECFSVDFNPIHTNDILDIHRYLMKRKWYLKWYNNTFLNNNTIK